MFKLKLAHVYIASKESELERKGTLTVHRATVKRLTRVRLSKSLGFGANERAWGSCVLYKEAGRDQSTNGKRFCVSDLLF